MPDQVNPFDDVDEKVQGPFDQKDHILWCDRNGYAHRVDGPAIEYKDGRKVWALHGNEATEEQVTAYRHKLGAEHHRRRREAEERRLIEVELPQYHTGLERKTTVKPPLRLKT